MGKYAYGWRRQFSDARDFRYEERVAKVALAPEVVPESADLSALILRVKNQNPLGSCVAHGTTSAFEALQVVRTGADFAGCRKEVYQNARIIGGYFPGDNGCAIRDGIKATVKYGVAHESLWQYQPTADFDKPIPSAVAADAKKAESTNYYLLDGQNAAQKVTNIRHCLGVTKLPVVFGTPVWQQFEEVGNSGIVEIPSANKQEIGQHCMMLFGYTKDHYYKVLNSWGETWGAPFAKFKGGMGLFPEAYVAKYFSDCEVIAGESELANRPQIIT